MTRIKVDGPCFLQLDAGGDGDEKDALLLEKGSSLLGEIHGFTIAVAPSDRTYADDSAQSIGDFPLRYIPNFVLSNCVILRADQVIEEGVVRALVGLSVPGATFQAVQP